MLKKAVIFGAGATGRTLYSQLKEQYEILYATDNDPMHYGKMFADNIEVKDKSELYKGGFDCVIVASYAGLNEISLQLQRDYKIMPDKILRNCLASSVNARIQFVESFAHIVYEKNIPGEIAEVGVFRGEFAKEINRAFPDRALYLFDTFEGFDERDVAYERSKGFSNSMTAQHSITTEALVYSKLPHKEKAIFKKGYFPDSFDLLDEAFCFVNLDTDLYLPTIAGLKIFWPLMSKRGVILVHDYFAPYYRGVRAAVDEFSEEEGAPIIPIGDCLSIAVVKPFQ